MNKLKENFSAVLKSARREQTQTQFAEFLGLSQPSYSRYEAGDIPDGQTLYQIATRLKLTLDQLLGLKPLEQTPEIMLKGEQEVSIGKLFIEIARQLESGVSPHELLNRIRTATPVDYPKKISSKRLSAAQRAANKAVEAWEEEQNPERTK